MLQHAIGHHTPEIADTGDENALQPDAGAPAALEELARELTQRVREHDGEHQEEHPHDLRHLVRAAGARLF